MRDSARRKKQEKFRERKSRRGVTVGGKKLTEKKVEAKVGREKGKKSRQTIRGYIRYLEDLHRRRTPASYSTSHRETASASWADANCILGSIQSFEAHIAGAPIAAKYELLLRTCGF